MRDPNAMTFSVLLEVSESAGASRQTLVEAGFVPAKK